MGWVNEETRSARLAAESTASNWLTVLLKFEHSGR
jgi:hypothetical protein